MNIGQATKTRSHFDCPAVNLVSLKKRSPTLNPELRSFMWPSKNIIQVLEHSPEPFIVYSHLYSQLENRLTAGCLQMTARTRTTTADRYTAHGLHSCILCTPLTPWVAAGPPRLISTSSGRRHACSRTRGLGAATRAPGWRGVIGRATRCEIMNYSAFGGYNQ